MAYQQQMMMMAMQQQQQQQMAMQQQAAAAAAAAAKRVDPPAGYDVRKVLLPEHPHQRSEVGMRHLVLVPGVGRRADLRKLTHKISWQEGEEASQRLGWNGVKRDQRGGASCRSGHLHAP